MRRSVAVIQLMTTSGYNVLLVLHLSGALIVSVAVLCRGEAALDSDGNEVGLASTGSMYRIQHYAEIRADGGLDVMPTNESACRKVIRHAAGGDKKNRALPAYFTPGPSAESNNAMEVGHRYKFSFISSTRPNPCKEPGVWTVGYVHGYRFRAVLAGLDPGTRSPDVWVEVRTTGKRGIYKLAVCPSELCGPAANCGELGTYQVNGTTVLGVGGDPFFVQFHKVEPRAMETAMEYLQFPVRIDTELGSEFIRAAHMFKRTSAKIKLSLD